LSCGFPCPGDKRFARGQENRDKNEKSRQEIEEIENQDKRDKQFARQFTTKAGQGNRDKTRSLS